MSLLSRRLPPRAEHKLSQAQRDLRLVLDQLHELGDGPFPLGTAAGRQFAQLHGQARNLRATISHLQEQLAPSPFAA